MTKKTVKTEAWFAFGFGIIALGFLFYVAIDVQSPSALLVTVSRVTLALACAGIAAVIPGFLQVELQPAVANVIRAGGALAVFVLVYFFSPAELISEPSDAGPAPQADYMPVVADWIRIIDDGRYLDAYELASAHT